MPDFSWLDGQQSLKRLLGASGAATGWRATLSRHTAGIEVEATRFAVLAPLARPVPLAVANPLAVLGPFTADAATNVDAESAATADSARTAPPSPAGRARSVPGPESRAPAGTRSEIDSRPAPSRPPAPTPLATERQPLPHPAGQRATAAQLRTLAGTLPDTFTATAPAAAGRRSRPGQATPPGPATQAAVGKPSPEVPPPPDGLSLLAQLARLPDGARTDPGPGTVEAPRARQQTAAGSSRPASGKKATPAAPVQSKPPPTRPDTPAVAAKSDRSVPFLLRALRSPVPSPLAPTTPGLTASSTGTVPAVPASRLATLLRSAVAAPEDAGPAAGQPDAPPAGARRPAIPFPRPTPAQSPTTAPRPHPGREVGLALLQRAVSGAESASPAPAPVPSTRPEAAAAPATDDTTPSAPSPPAPAVQNTFNVKVHMDGHPAGEEELAARLNRILVEQARRFGIDV